MVFRSICVQEFLRGSSSCYAKEQTLAATNRRRNPKSPGKSDVNGKKNYDVYRQHVSSES